jgi:3'(2'), 5'-bisphosphate nucleotidase
MLEKELKTAIRLCREAGRIVLKYYDQEVEVTEKKDGPVTQADKASNAFITTQLREAFPSDGILAEESKDNAERLSLKRVWIVDPMDGTREFIDKIGQFAVMIGLAEGGKPVLGVVYQPTEDKLFYAVKGSGAFLETNGTNEALKVSDVDKVSDMRVVVSRSHRSPLVDGIMKKLGIGNDVSSGSVGLKVGLMVEQKADLYMHPNSKTKEWDTCAPQVILEEAGGRITDCWGAPLTYNKSNSYNDKGFIASNGKHHGEIVATALPFLADMD